MLRAKWPLTLERGEGHQTLTLLGFLYPVVVSSPASAIFNFCLASLNISSHDNLRPKPYRPNHILIRSIRTSLLSTEPISAPSPLSTWRNVGAYASDLRQAVVALPGPVYCG